MKSKYLNAKTNKFIATIDEFGQVKVRLQRKNAKSYYFLNSDVEADVEADAKRNKR